MAERFVKSQIAERVADFIGTREGRGHLEAHGWAQGMPIIMAQANEPLDDVMGLVAIQDQATLIAVIDPQEDHLHFLYICMPTAALKDVEACPTGTEVWQLFKHSLANGATTFKSRYAKHSIVAHSVPPFDRKAAIPAEEQQERLAQRPE